MSCQSLAGILPDAALLHGWTDGLRRMEGVFAGDLDSAMIFNAAVALSGQALEHEIFDLPAAS